MPEECVLLFVFDQSNRKESIFLKKRVRAVPSVPDIESKPGLYNEPEVVRKEDIMPDGGFKRVQDVLSKAELRLQVEELLRRPRLRRAKPRRS